MMLNVLFRLDKMQCIQGFSLTSYSGYDGMILYRPSAPQTFLAKLYTHIIYTHYSIHSSYKSSNKLNLLVLDGASASCFFSCTSSAALRLEIDSDEAGPKQC